MNKEFAYLNKLLFVVFVSVIGLFTSCSPSSSSVPEGDPVYTDLVSVSFQDTVANYYEDLTQKQKVSFEFSDHIDYDSSFKIVLEESSTAVYGTDFETFPPLENGSYEVVIPGGTTFKDSVELGTYLYAPFSIGFVDNSVLDNDRTVTFSIQESSGVLELSPENKPLDIDILCDERLGVEFFEEKRVQLEENTFSGWDDQYEIDFIYKEQEFETPDVDGYIQISLGGTALNGVDYNLYYMSNHEKVALSPSASGFRLDVEAHQAIPHVFLQLLDNDEIDGLKNFEAYLSASSDGIGIGERDVIEVDILDEDSPKIIYVDKDANGTNKGTSWEDAFESIDIALASLSSGVEEKFRQLWIAEGTYSIMHGQSLNIRIDDVAVYGGFSGNEVTLDQRNWATNRTIISGNGTDYIFDVGVQNGSSYGFVTNFVLDGFYLTDAYVSQNRSVYGGGGAVSVGSYCTGTINNCYFFNNKGYNEKCYGTAVFVEKNSEIRIENSVFVGNTTRNGCISIGSKTKSFVVNSTFFDNSGEKTAQDIVDGTEPNGGIQFKSDSQCVSFNSIFSKSGSASDYSAGQMWDNVLFDEFPGFVLEDRSNKVIETIDDLLLLQLKSSSSAVNTGDKSYSTLGTDINSNTRVVSNVIDLGAFELQ